jgi:hypothetical protein
MNTPPALISRMSIFILSFFLVHTGVAIHRLPPPFAVNCVLVGTVGFIAYFGLEFAAFQRSRSLACRLLTACAMWPNPLPEDVD